MVTGSCATVNRVILQGHTICTSTGQKLMLERQSLDTQTEYFIIFGKRAKPIIDVTECAISKIDGLDLASWHHQKLLTWLQHQETRGLVYYPKQELMLKKCLPIKLYQYQSTIHSSLNQYKTGWSDLKLNYHTKFPQEDLQEIPLRKQTTN